MTALGKRKDTYYALICFFVCFIPRIIINLGIKASTGGHDDLGFLAVPSYLAGYDWSGVIKHTSYYGFGFSALFMTPIIKIFGGTPFLMFQIMWATVATFQSLVAVAVYYIAYDLFEYKDRNFCAISGIIMSYLTFCSSCRLENDSVMPLFIWGIILILSLLIKSDEHRMEKTICLDLVVIFLQFMHTRSVIIWIALSIVVIIYRIMEKRWPVCPKTYLAGMVIGTYLVKKTVSYVQTVVWGTTDLANSSAGLKNQLLSGVESGSAIEYIRSFVFLCAGELFTIIQFSNILFAVGLVSILFFLFDKIKRDDRKAEFYSLIFLLILFMGMLGASGLYWNEDARNAMASGEFSKGFFYLRYISTFAMPIAFWGIALTRDINMKYMALLSFFYIVLCLFVISNIGALPNQDLWATFASKYKGNFKSMLTQNDLSIVSIVSLSVFFFFWLLCRKSGKIKALSMVFLLVATFYNYTYQIQNGAKMWGESVYNSVDGLRTLNTAFLDDFNIYCNDDIQKYALQLSYPGIAVKDYEDYNGEKKSVLISRDTDGIKKTDLYYVICDDEVIYFSDAETKKSVLERINK